MSEPLPYNLRPKLRLAYGIVAVGGKIPLLTKRDRRTGKEFYTLPGGTLEGPSTDELEDYEVCLTREFTEEVGIRVRVKRAERLAPVRQRREKATQHS